MDKLQRRRHVLRSDLDLATLYGMEFGPLNTPAVSKAEGNVIYVDHANAEALRAKYRGHAHVDPTTICDVDLVYDETTLAELRPGSVDYVIASHVAEHIPDLTTWLRQIQRCLTPNGELRLVLPDKRFSSDYLRRESSTAELLDAYVHQLRKPRTLQILDTALDSAHLDPRKAYAGDLTEDDFVPFHDYDMAIAIARDALAAGHYLDVHCWVFSPESFARNMENLVAAGLLDMECSRFVDTEYDHWEFFAFLRPCTNRQRAIDSWRDMRRLAADGLQVLPAGIRNSAVARLIERNVELAAQNAELAAQNAELAAQDAELTHAVAAMRASSSWRITAPIRAVSRLLMSRRRR